MTESEIRTLEFDTEVSTWYHEFRRGFFTTLVMIVRAVSLLGSIVALLAVSGWVESDETRVLVVAGAGVLITIVNLMDLVFQYDVLARDHTSLYQRFKTLQSKIAGGRKDWKEHIDEWRSEAQFIRVDEPPTYWGVYNICRNQVLEKHKVAEGNRRKVEGVRRWFRHFRRYRPDDFAVA